MKLRLFLDVDFAETCFRQLGVSVSEFAAGVIGETADISAYMFNRLEQYNSLVGDPLFAVANSAKEADAILLPADWAFAGRRAPEIARHYLNLSDVSGKPLIVSSLGDTTKEIPGKRTIVLRTSKYRWSAKKNEIFCPPVVNDRLAGKKIEWIDGKPSRPKVGFVGQSQKNKTNPLSNFLRFGKKDYLLSLSALMNEKYGNCRSGLYFRSKALQMLAADPRIDDKFIKRNSWGLDVRQDESVLRSQTQEYDNNIASNMFTVCVRGAGNFSLRLYEVLSIGRIPLLIDTDDVRPLEGILDYNEFCCIIKGRDIDKLPGLFLDFYDGKSPNQLLDMQTSARSAFVDYLEFKTFSRRVFNSILPEMIGR